MKLKKIVALSVAAVMSLSATLSVVAAHPPQSEGLGKGELLWEDTFEQWFTGNVPFVLVGGAGDPVDGPGPALSRDGNILRYVTEGGRTFMQQEGHGAGGAGMQIRFSSDEDIQLTYSRQLFMQFDIYTNHVAGNIQLMVGGQGSNASYMRIQNTGEYWRVMENPPGGGTNGPWIQVTGEGTSVPHQNNTWKTFTIFVDTATGANELYINGVLTAGISNDEMYARRADGSRASDSVLGVLWFDSTNNAGSLLRVGNIRIYEAVAGGRAVGAAAEAAPTTPAAPVEAAPTPVVEPPVGGALPAPVGNEVDKVGVGTPAVPPTGDAMTIAFAVGLGALLVAAVVVRKRVKA